MEGILMSDSTNGGISLGSVVAGILSWMKWHSVGLAILHAICSWFYVVYYILGIIYLTSEGAHDTLIYS